MAMVEAQGGGANCYDILAGSTELLDNAVPDGIPYFIIGGTAAAFLEHPSTTFSSVERLILAEEELHVPQFRPNGTMRDVDILLLTSDQGLLDDVTNDMRGHINGALEVSVFGVEKHEPYVASRWQRVVGDFLSQRTQDLNGDNYLVLGPLVQAVKAESYAQWHSELPNGEVFPTMSPMGQLMCYITRSVSGVRHKDRGKIETIATNVLPEFEPLAIREDGLYREWAEFSIMLDRLKEAQVDGNLAERIVMAAKANGLAFVERFDWVVDLGQRESMQEGVLKRFVGKT